MIDLVGKKFKRNKYGLSKWTETVASSFVQWRYCDKTKSYSPIFNVRGENGVVFLVTEIVFVDILSDKKIV